MKVDPIIDSPLMMLVNHMHHIIYSLLLWVILTLGKYVLGVSHEYLLGLLVLAVGPVLAEGRRVHLRVPVQSTVPRVLAERVRAFQDVTLDNVLLRGYIRVFKLKGLVPKGKSFKHDGHASLFVHYIIRVLILVGGV